MTLPIEENIADLVNREKPLLHSQLSELSNLSSEEMALLKHHWPRIDTNRRRQIVHRLVELAEDNLELNFDSVFKHCLSDGSKEVRWKAIEGLWENEEASLISPLIELLKLDNSEQVQAAAATALGKFAMLAEHGKLRSCHISNIQEALLPAINDEGKPVEVRRRALEATAPLSLPQVKTAIMKAYQSQVPGLKISAIYAMGKNCDSGWLPLLTKELASIDAEICYEAAGACGELEEEEAVPHLIELVNNPDSDIQTAAVQALGKIGGTGAKECLEHCLKQGSQVVRQTAKEALAELELKEVPLSFPV